MHKAQASKRTVRTLTRQPLQEQERLRCQDRLIVSF